MKQFQKIPSGSGEAEYIEKKSRFISHVFYVETAEEANEKLAELRKKYWDATHNCYAYVLDSDNVMRFSDDGEPQGTAGMPILEVLKKQQVYCALIVVTRYFGGTLLGAGGLVRAYAKAAKMAIDTAGICEFRPYTVFSLTVDYSHYEKIKKELDTYCVKCDDCSFGEKVTFTLAAEEKNLKAFEDFVNDFTKASATFEKLSERYDA